MQAIYLKDGVLSAETTHPIPQPKKGEALIKISVAGVCSTDLELVKGYYPFTGVLGHEFVGVVEQCDDAAWVGKRVVGTINLSPDCNGDCGLRCPEQCPHRVVLGIANKDGAFAEYITLPIPNLLAVPDSVSDLQAVFTEPLAAAVRITEQIEVAEQKVALIGPGRLGLLIAQTLRHFGADVTVFGRSQTSLDFATSLGLNAKRAAEADNQQFDIVVDSTGNPAGLQLAVGLIRPNGTIVLKSTYANEPNFFKTFENLPALLATIVVNEITIIGSRCGPFDKALELLESGAIETQSFIEQTYTLTDGLAAFEHAAQRGTLKILLA